MAKEFICMPEVAECLECSQGQAYKIIRMLNAELKRKGFCTISGRVPRVYFEERYGLVKPSK